MSKAIRIGNKIIGGGNPVAIQSMCNTRTKDAEATISQILALENAGCAIVRVAVPDMESAAAISEIKKYIHIPLVADIHFDYKLALASIENGVDKVHPYQEFDPDVHYLQTEPCPYETPFPGHIYLIKNMLGVLNGEEKPIVTPEETINVATILELFYKSAKEGREVFAAEI